MTDPKDILIGVPVGAIVWGALKWLGDRAVKHEDKAKEELKTRLTTAEQNVANIGAALNEYKIENRTVAPQIEQLKGQLTALKELIEQRTEKQAESHRAQLKELVTSFDEKLRKLEYDTRQDMARAIADSLPSRRGRK